MTSITINQIKYVLALYKTGSFSVAAETCFVTQSTLSTMIKKLEQSLDIELFDRKKKPIQLTQEGEKLIAQFKVVYNETENLLEQIQETKEEYSGTLQIGIIPTIAPFLLPLFLDKMVKKFPNIEFNIMEITTDEIIQRLKFREIDLGILSLPIADKEIHSISLFKEEFIVYDTSTTTKQNKKYTISDIDVNRLWLLEESHCLTNQIEKICHLRNKSRGKSNLVFKSGSILTLLKLIHQSNGITLLPKLATHQTNLIKKKYVYDLEAPIPVRDIGIATHINFNKKRILEILNKEIVKAVEPKLGKSEDYQIIKPF